MIPSSYRSLAILFPRLINQSDRRASSQHSARVWASSSHRHITMWGAAGGAGGAGRSTLGLTGAMSIIPEVERTAPDVPGPGHGHGRMKGHDIDERRCVCVVCCVCVNVRWEGRGPGVVRFDSTRIDSSPFQSNRNDTTVQGSAAAAVAADRDLRRAPHHQAGTSIISVDRAIG